MKTLFFALILCFTITSCSTLFNKRIDIVNIKSNEAVKVVVDNDSINKLLMEHTVVVERGEKNISITLYNDSLEKTISVYSQLSFSYWLNFLSPFSAGFLVDMSSPKRFDYPNNISVDMNDASSIYYDYNIYNPKLINAKNSLKLTPLKAIGLFNPRLELSYERLLSKNISLQISGGYLMPVPFRRNYDYFISDRTGFTATVEGRYYLNQTFAGTYVAMNFDYLNSNHPEIRSFLDTDRSFLFQDSITVIKQTYTTNFLVGYQKVVGSFVFNFYAGLGLRFRDVKYKDLTLDNAVEIYRRNDFFPIEDFYENSNLRGFTNSISIPLNMKVGYLF